MKVLTLGGAGFIGSHLVDALLARGDEVTVMDDLSLGKQANLPETIDDEWLGENGGCANAWNLYNVVKNNKQFDLIFNLAVHPLPESLELPDYVVMTNLKITLYLLEQIRRMPRVERPRLVHFSSSEVYGTSPRQLSEKNSKYPETPYAASKVACDALVESYVNTFAIDAVIVRPFNTIGSRQNQGSYAAVIPETINRIKTGKIPYITGDGQQSRDFVYVSDIVEGALLAADRGMAGETYNLATGYPRTIKYVVENTARLMGYGGTIDYVPARPGDVQMLRGDASKAMTELGWKPKVKFDDALRKTVTWYMEGEI